GGAIAAPIAKPYLIRAATRLQSASLIAPYPSDGGAVRSTGGGINRRPGPPFKRARHARRPERNRKGRPLISHPANPYHRFENWNDRRALALPYFLRSTTRLSRVRKPPRLSTLRNSGSKFVSALESPWRTAPAWPDSPPPDTRQMTSYWPLRFDITS